LRPSDCILFSGGAAGAEAEFGAAAERYGVEEVNFTFDGHHIARQRGFASSITRSCSPATSVSRTCPA
jgi:hypothetical protein